MTDDETMSGHVVNLVPEPEPDHREWLLNFRARVATDIADNRRSDMICSDLIAALDDRLAGSRNAIIAIDEDMTQIQVSSLPGRLSGVMHAQHRRNWFGSWAAAISRQSPIAVVDVAESSLYREYRRYMVESELAAANAAPLRSSDQRVSGVLVSYLPNARLLTEDERDVFDLVAELAALVLRRDDARQQLLDRIRYDALTGLENRDGLEEVLRRALAAVDQDGPGVGLLFVDIDDLTLVNDSLGHRAGDTVIALTAGRIRNHLMHADTVVRFGGDEFIVVLNRIESSADARLVADRIRREIAVPMEVEDTNLTTTVSIGITLGHKFTAPSS